MELVWKYGRLSSISFLKSSIPFWHLPYSIAKFPFHSIFHSILFHSMSWFQWRNQATRTQKPIKGWVKIFFFFFFWSLLNFRRKIGRCSGEDLFFISGICYLQKCCLHVSNKKQQIKFSKSQLVTVIQK